MITKIIVNHLRAGAAVAALLGQRIWPLVLPQGCAKPAAAVTVATDLPVSTLCGPTKKRRALVQIDVYAETAGSKGGDEIADEAAAAIEARMADQSGGFKCLPQGRFEDYDDVTQQYHVRMDFSVWRKQ